MKRNSVPSSLRLLPLLAVLAAAFAPAAQAQSLVDLYNAARNYDAPFQSARAQYDANLARAAQAESKLLPTVGLQATASRSSVELPGVVSERGYGTQTVGVSASQPLYRPANLAAYEQGKKAAELARIAMQAAEQSLIVRVSQAYFDVLASTDSLTFVRSQKAANGEQLAAAKRNFEVGTSTITDQREAQARYDIVVAQEIAAENDLRVKTIALNKLVGLPNAAPKPLLTPVLLNDVQPSDIEYWVREGQAHNANVRAAEMQLDIAKLDTATAIAGHKPTLDLTASYGQQYNNGTATPGDNKDSRANSGSIGVTFTLPLYAGGAIRNRVKETSALEEKARTDLEDARRTADQTTRTAYMNLKAGAAQVKAYEAAEISSQSALDANKLGYQVGVRINIDVLNSQSQLYDTKAKLAKARYDVLVGGLGLRQAVGTLTSADLDAVNALLAK